MFELRQFATARLVLRFQPGKLRDPSCLFHLDEEFHVVRYK